jgi:hypothetical protein
VQTSQGKSRTRRRRADTPLIFDPAQKVPDPVLDAIVRRVACALPSRAVPSRARVQPMSVSVAGGRRLANNCFRGQQFSLLGPTSGLPAIREFAF